MPPAAAAAFEPAEDLPEAAALGLAGRWRCVPRALVAGLLPAPASSNPLGEADDEIGGHIAVAWVSPAEALGGRRYARFGGLAVALPCEGQAPRQEVTPSCSQRPATFGGVAIPEKLGQEKALGGAPVRARIQLFPVHSSH